MKPKIWNILLIITSLFGYLEWGGGNSSFLFEAEYEVLIKFFTNPESVFNFFILIPLAGQFILVGTLFQKTPGRKLTLLGMACIGILLGFMFIIGISGRNPLIFLSTLPFFLTAFYIERNFLKKS